MKPKILGKSGETLAAKYLHTQNYDPVCTNYHCRFGEIDIIVLDKNVKPRQLVFVEVKTRTDLQFGTPQESITFSKKQKLIKTALHFFNQSSPKLAMEPLKNCLMQGNEVLTNEPYWLYGEEAAPKLTPQEAVFQRFPSSWRMDLIAIILDHSGSLKELQHFKNILNG